MKHFSDIIKFIRDNFNESVTLRLMLKDHSMGKDELVSSFIDKENCTRHFAEQTISDAVIAGFLVFDNGNYSLCKTYR